MSKIHKNARLYHPQLWMLTGVVICITLDQSMVFSFVERGGNLHHFGHKKVEMALIIMSFINLAPGILASLLQKRVSAVAVGITGPCLQALFALSITRTLRPAFTQCPSRCASHSLFSPTHLFFGLISSRSQWSCGSSTPAMMMIGAATGPLLGGTIVATIGYQGLGWAVAMISCIAVILMVNVHRCSVTTS
ncbi:hypothetical protein P4S72_30450 [Vibrio sp. PP-XX7]